MQVDADGDLARSHQLRRISTGEPKHVAKRERLPLRSREGPRQVEQFHNAQVTSLSQDVSRRLRTSLELACGDLEGRAAQPGAEVSDAGETSTRLSEGLCHGLVGDIATTARVREDGLPYIRPVVSVRAFKPLSSVIVQHVADRSLLVDYGGV